MEEIDIIETARTPLHKKIVLHLKGEGDLSWSFWRFYFIGGLILFFALCFFFLLSLPFVYVEGQSVMESRRFQVGLGIGLVIFLFHAIASFIMVWRCSENTEFHLFKYLARGYMVAWIYQWFRLLSVLISS